jgi:hypothetical protein
MNPIPVTMRAKIILLLYISTIQLVHAQVWTKKDSLWLERIKRGEEKIQLNEQTKQAIKSGSFLNTKPIGKQKISKSTLLPIQNDFSEYIHPEYKKPLKSYKDTPPAVFMRRNIEMKPVDTLEIRAFFITEKLKTEMKGYHKGKISFSADDILKHIFMPSERRKKKNRRRAAAFKY